MVMSEVFGSERAVIEIPLFPLPHVVFFPGTLLPLHIFEPQYRTMISQSLEGDRRIGMILMREEPDPAPGASKIYSVGGMGRISDVRELEDGRFDILLSGLSRFRILEVLEDSPYKRARVELLQDVYEEHPQDEDLRRELIQDFRELIELEDLDLEDPEMLEEADFVTLTNSACSALQILPQDKQALLEMDDVRGRAEAVRSVIGHLLAQRDFVDQFDHLRPEDPLFN